jgi:hypothetical protein
MIYSITANLALAMQGPYDHFVQAHPDLYTRIARWFSPVERFRPLLNPHVQAGGRFHFSGSCWSGEQPLLSLGEFGSRYALSAECLPHNRLKLISGNAPLSANARTIEVLSNQPGLNSAGIEFTPEDSMMAVKWNGVTVLRHPLPFLITARSQISFDGDPSIPDTPRLDSRFTSFSGADH